MALNFSFWNSDESGRVKGSQAEAAVLTIPNPNKATMKDPSGAVHHPVHGSPRGLMDDTATIQSILVAMHARQPATLLTHSVHIHPTGAELIPTLFGELRSLKQPKSAPSELNLPVVDE
jgi:hypothetical protein